VIISLDNVKSKNLEFVSRFFLHASNPFLDKEPINFFQAFYCRDGLEQGRIYAFFSEAF